MKRRHSLPVLAALVGLAAPALAGPPPKRTLAELIALARQRAPTVTAAAAQVDIRRGQRSEAIRNWFPSGELTFGISGAPRAECRPPQSEMAEYNALTTEEARKNYRTRDCAVTVDPRTNENLSYFSTNFAGVAGELNLRLTQPLYTFGKIEHGVKAAEYGIEAEQRRVDIARSEIELQVARAYWGLKATRTSLITAREARGELADWVHRIEEDLDRDQQRYNFTINDLQRLKLGLSTIEIAIADLERNEGIARRGLQLAIGEDTEIDDAELDAVEIVERPIDYYDKAALTNRPEVRALNAGVNAYRELTKLRLAEMLPDVALVGSLLWRFAPTVESPQSGFLYQPNVFGYGAYLSLRQPLDLFERHARWTRQRAEADALVAQKKLAISGIGLEIAQAYENLGEARRRLAAADRGQRVSRGWLNAVNQNIELGTADARDLVDAASNYIQLRLRYYQAIFDFNLNVWALRRAAGVELLK